MKNVIVILLTLFLFCCFTVNGQDYLQIANDCFEKGDYECAKRNYTFFQTFDGRDMSAQIQTADECIRALILADNYFNDGEWEKAGERYRIVLDKNPQDPHVQKQFDLCVEYLKSANETLQDIEPEEAQEREAKEDNQQIAVVENEAGPSPSEILNVPVRVEKKPDSPRIKTESPGRRSGMLYVAGGVCLAGGIAASMLSAKPYTEASNGMMVEGKKYSLAYAGVGMVVGGVCIGKGIQLKKKERVQAQNMDHGYSRSRPPSNGDRYSSLNLVVYGNEAGLRFTF